ERPGKGQRRSPEPSGKEERESAAFYSSLVELVPLSGTYEQARRYATCLGGSLIRITDAGTQGIVEDLIDSSGKQQRFWTAGYYQDGKWRWDETNAVEFSAWAEDEPSESGSGARLLVSEDGSWVSEEDLSSSCMFLIRYNR
ncbi:MAG: C-type lectin domain-containing protein, partial [Lachnospiraceae bacterium]|nr:C-type lectin domain-containing protein [Lachnospiraceae bacterium]